MALVTHQVLVKPSLSRGLVDIHQLYAKQLKYAKGVNSQKLIHGKLKVKERLMKRRCILLATSEDQLSYSEIKEDIPEHEKDQPLIENSSLINNLNAFIGVTGGKPGLISFYNRPYGKQEQRLIAGHEENQNSLLWFVGPGVLVTSFIFPSLYLRRILSTVFEDSLLTDFLILFFTEALFYCGVAVFLLLVDRLWRHVKPLSGATNGGGFIPSLGYRISSVAVLVLSLMIPMVTMGLVWPWTGPAASATLAPYLVGLVVQFAFEQCARYKKSPSWPVIPVIFQVYRLHQLNRAAQLVTALSFTARGAEMTSHNLAINNSLVCWMAAIMSSSQQFCPKVLDDACPLCLVLKNIIKPTYQTHLYPI